MAAALLVSADLCKTVLHAIVSPTVLGVARAPWDEEKSHLCYKVPKGERAVAFCLPESCSLWSGVVEWKQQLPDLCIDVELVPDKLCHVAPLRHSKDIFHRHGAQYL